MRFPAMTANLAKILIVDDNPVNIEVLASILEGDYQVFFATSGRRALELMESEAIDLVLLDIMMPEMDGYTVCKRLKGDAALAEVPVIFITAMNEVQDEARGFELGAVDYITKPVSAPIVRARVRTHLELKSQRDQLRRLSTIDGLTGIPNRRWFDENMECEWQRAKRLGITIGLLLIDIDYFKRFNDDYGHVAGDDCLCKVANALESSLHRGADFVARYGGEEFAVILPDCAVEGAAIVAERLREKVASLDMSIPAVDNPRRVTLSIGAGAVAPSEDKEIGTFIEQVDGMLYQAKAQGRNRVVSHGLSPFPPHNNDSS